MIHHGDTYFLLIIADFSTDWKVFLRKSAGRATRVKPRMLPNLDAPSPWCSYQMHHQWLTEAINEGLFVKTERHNI